MEGRLVLDGGRALGYLELGDRGGLPVLYCHGFPASRLEARLADAAAARGGVRLVAADRPGYGRSDFQPGRRLSDWAGDLAALADHLGIARFAVLGVSGGGPYALACGARLGRRLRAVGVVAGLGRIEGPGYARMNPFARLAFGLARRHPGASQRLSRALALALRRHPQWMFGLICARAPAADRAVLADPAVRATLIAAFGEALRQGGRGAAHDLRLYVQDWDFEPRAIAAPCLLWHGEQDATVPVEMARRLAAEIPGCRAEFAPGEGHFSLPVGNMQAILRALVARS